MPRRWSERARERWAEREREHEARMVEFRAWAAEMGAASIADDEEEARLRAAGARPFDPSEKPRERRARDIEEAYRAARTVALRRKGATGRDGDDGLSVSEARAIRRRVTAEVDARLDSEKAVAVRSLDDGALARRIADLEAELAPLRTEQSRRLRLARQGLHDAMRGVVAEDEHPRPGDVIPARDGGRIAFRSLGGRSWRMSPGQAAQFGRPDLADKTVRYAYGTPLVGDDTSARSLPPRPGRKVGGVVSVARRGRVRTFGGRQRDD